jgi:hypothetical protein
LNGYVKGYLLMDKQENGRSPNETTIQGNLFCERPKGVKQSPRSHVGMASGFALAMTGKVSILAERRCAVGSLAMT